MKTPGPEQVPSLLPPPPPAPSAAAANPSPPPLPPPPHPLPLRAIRDRRNSLPFSFPPLFFSSNTSSTSLVPSTAEGRPIPLDNTTAAHRTSALRELNSNYPSPVLRHGYAKSTGAKNTTYSQPVIVRTYSGPSHPHSHAGHYRHPSAGRPTARRTPLSASSTSPSFFGSAAASRSTGGVGVSSIGKQHASGGGLLSMPRPKAKTKSPWHWDPGIGASQEPEEAEEDKLPPLEAFTFKSFMAEIQDSDIGADLDRIAEICARSRYSLSNQYEVHVAPHGSGSSFITPAQSSNGRRKGHARKREAGPTLQAIQSDDDENNARTHRKRRSGGRRKSAAYGTLETIMSSSRSSEEDKTRKPPAAEIAKEVRGRASREGSERAIGSDSGSGSGSGSRAREEAQGESVTGQGTSTDQVKTPGRKKSAAFAHAVMDSTMHVAGTGASPRGSTAALVSGPALPQTSSSHLEIRTSPITLHQDNRRHSEPPDSPTESGTESSLSQELPHAEEARTSEAGLLSSFSNWIPWSSGGGAEPSSSQPDAESQPSQVAETLREFLKTTGGKQSKGKEIVRE